MVSLARCLCTYTGLPGLDRLCAMPDVDKKGGRGGEEHVATGGVSIQEQNIMDMCFSPIFIGDLDEDHFEPSSFYLGQVVEFSSRNE